jgi:hypothetical protein
MTTIKQFLVITGSALIIASCQDANNESDLAATEQSAVDTVPKGRTDSMRERLDTMTGKPDTMISGMPAPNAPQYIDLKTGQPVELYYDPKTRKTYSAVTNEPVEFYIDVSTGDTIYGRGRYVVNNYIMRSDNGMYKLDANKIKMDKDDIKIKEGNKKFKMDKSNMKMKGTEMKMKGDTTKGKMKMKMEDKTKS